ncbi:FAD-dependent oxidoreductase [Phenylobacterium sp.]|uniref:FAD-dependent oxidoreductase n=1 Tax=Phenylobacterium sp. TaxID=1871053 RepID=UPI002FC8331F
MVDPDLMLDVLVVGGGPTGSALAIDLARRGLRVRIIEKNAHSFPGSRAKGLQPRTLEVLDDLGVVADALAAGDLYPPLGVHVGPLVIPRRMYKTRKATSDIPYPNTLLIPQFETDALLHRRLAALGVRVEFNARLKAFVETDEGVQATVEHPGGEETITCRYMVGADGGASSVREQLKIGFPGRTDEADRMIIVDCKVEGLSRDYWHAWPGGGGRFVVACPLPHGDLFQWMIRLKPGEEPRLDEAALNHRVRDHTRSKKLRLHDIRWTSVFRPNIRLADHYRQGRVFLAGDAAHVHTPAGAQGLNTGVQDAYNLGWKLAQALNGAPATLLDSYEAERQPVAARVLGMSTQKYEAMNRGGAEASRRGADEQQLGITYRRGPLGDGGASTSTLAVGDRAPDAVLKDLHGAPVRLFDVFRGPHFTALAFGVAAAQDLSRLAWSRQGAGLKRVAINPGSGADADVVLRDAGETFASAYGLTGDALILVRPDGYIAQIARDDRVAATARAAARLTPPL